MRLWSAVSRGDLAEVTRLIEVEGLDIDGSPSPILTTPLMAAIIGNYYEIFDFLMNNRANIEIVRNGQNALTRAVILNRQRMVQRLIEAGATVNPPTVVSPLKYSLIGGNPFIIEMLIKARASPEEDPIGLDTSNAELLRSLIPLAPGQEFLPQPLKQSELRRVVRYFTPGASAALIGERAWARRAAAVKAWAAARDAAEAAENGAGNGGAGNGKKGGARRRKSRRSRKASKKLTRRRH